MGFLGVCPPPYISMGQVWGGLCEAPSYCAGSPCTDGWGLAIPLLWGRASCLLRRRKDASLHHPPWLELQARAQLCGL